MKESKSKRIKTTSADLILDSYHPMLKRIKCWDGNNMGWEAVPQDDRVGEK